MTITEERRYYLDRLIEQLQVLSDPEAEYVVELSNKLMARYWAGNERDYKQHAGMLDTLKAVRNRTNNHRERKAYKDLHGAVKARLARRVRGLELMRKRLHAKSLH